MHTFQDLELNKVLKLERVVMVCDPIDSSSASASTMFHLERVILELNRVDPWSGAHPNQMPSHAATALTYFQTLKKHDHREIDKLMRANTNTQRQLQTALAELQKKKKDLVM